MRESASENLLAFLLVFMGGIFFGVMAGGIAGHKDANEHWCHKIAASVPCNPRLYNQIFIEECEK